MTSLFSLSGTCSGLGVWLLLMFFSPSSEVTDAEELALKQDALPKKAPSKILCKHVLFFRGQPECGTVSSALNT